MLKYNLPQVTARGVISTPPSPVPPSLGSIFCGAAAATDKRLKRRNPCNKNVLKYILFESTNLL